MGCIYKAISKVLTNKCRIISKNRLTFIHERQILDGILVLNEIANEAGRKKKEVIIFKVNFGKAYDSVDWNFIVFGIEKMRFHEKCTKWINECLSLSFV